MLRVIPLRGLLAFVLLFVVGVPFLAGCGGGGVSGTPDDSDLVVTYFSMRDRTDVYRNQFLEIRFSAPVNAESVSNRTIQFLTGPSQATPATGALIVDGDRVYFDPTRSQEAYDRGDKTANSPFGFEAVADYKLFIPGPPTRSTLRNRAGRPILAEYVSDFRTSDEYTPELDQPEFIGVGELPDGSPTFELGFVPPKYLDEDPGSPTYGDVVVSYNAQIVIRFDEAVLPASMEPGETIFIKNQDVKDYLGRPVDVPGTFKPSMNGTEYVFTPSFHYGTGPYTIAVIMTNMITDLARNPLLNPRTVYFKTEFEPNVNTIGFVVESFSSSRYEDGSNTTAEWDSIKKGELHGGPITTNIVTVNYNPDGVNSRNANLDVPLVARQTGPGCFAWPKGVRSQHSYSADDIGMEGSVTKIAWGPDSNAVFAANYPNIEIRLGNTKAADGVLGPVFDDNFRDGLPLAHYSGRYDVPQRANIDPDVTEAFWAFPTLTTPFDYSHVYGIVIDFQVTAADMCQTTRGWFWGLFAGGPGFRNIIATDRDATMDDYTGGGQPWIADMQFTLRRRVTQAQSKFYDTAQPAPHYSDPIVTPSSQLGGAAVTLEVQGADGMLDSRGRTVADPATVTTWSTNIDVADSKRFIRFRFKMYANLNSDTVPRVNQVQFPYEF